MILKNGKDLIDALKEIAAYKEPTKYKDNKYPYYEYYEYSERMNNVFGEDGYMMEYKMEPHFILPSGQVMSTAVCKISVLGEEGNAVYTVTGIGTVDMTISTKSGQFIGINNQGLFVQMAAFKSACKEFNIFNCIYNDNNKKNGLAKKGNASLPSSNLKSQNSKTGAKKMSFYVSTMIEEIRKDNHTDKSVYKLMGQEIIANQMRENKVEILFYPNKYDKVPDWEEKLLAISNIPKRITMEVKPVNGKENSFVFESF